LHPLFYFTSKIFTFFTSLPFSPSPFYVENPAEGGGEGDGRRGYKVELKHCRHILFDKKTSKKGLSLFKPSCVYLNERKRYE